MNNAVSKTGLKDRWSLIRVVFILKFDCICEGEPEAEFLAQEPEAEFLAKELEAEFLGSRTGSRISTPRAGGGNSRPKNQKQIICALNRRQNFLRPRTEGRTSRPQNWRQIS